MTNNQFLEICKKYLKNNKKKFHTKYLDEVNFLYASFKKYCLEFFLNENEEKHIFEWLSDVNYSSEFITDDLDDETNIVKKVCAELGITQKELAEKFGISTSAISQWNEDIPKTAQVALELLIENKKLKDDLNIIKKAHEILHR